MLAALFQFFGMPADIEEFPDAKRSCRFNKVSNVAHMHYSARNLNIGLYAGECYFPVYVFISVSCTQLLSLHVLCFTVWHSTVAAL